MARPAFFATLLPASRARPQRTRGCKMASNARRGAGSSPKTIPRNSARSGRPSASNTPAPNTARTSAATAGSSASRRRAQRSASKGFRAQPLREEPGERGFAGADASGDGDGGHGRRAKAALAASVDIGRSPLTTRTCCRRASLHAGQVGPAARSFEGRGASPTGPTCFCETRRSRQAHPRKSGDPSETRPSLRFRRRATRQDCSPHGHTPGTQKKRLRRGRRFFFARLGSAANRITSCSSSAAGRAAARSCRDPRAEVVPPRPRWC